MNQQATELEEAIIGACLIEQEALPLVADKLRPEMFYDNRHQLIFACLTAMYQAGKRSTYSPSRKNSSTGATWKKQAAHSPSHS